MIDSLGTQHYRVSQLPFTGEEHLTMSDIKADDTTITTPDEVLDDSALDTVSGGSAHVEVMHPDVVHPK